MPNQTPGSGVGDQKTESEGPSKDIFRIYDEFVAAQTVAGECEVHEPGLEEQHRKNFLSVSRAVRRELTGKHGKPESTLDEFLRGHDAVVRTRTLEMLRSHPCDSADARVVIERYRAQSQWKVPAGR